MLTLRRTSWIAAFAGLLCVASAQAADTVFLAPAAIAKHQQTVGRLEEYLSGLSTIVADFTQVAPDGSLATGKFYLERPGKMRWQYNPPVPILMVADSNELVYYDYELEQVTHIPMDSTLIGFLAQKNIRFGGMVGIENIEEASDAIRITVARKDKPDDGQLTLEFSDKPLLLRNMIVRDATGQTTTVSLNHARFGIALDKQLFIWHDPRQGRIH